MKSSTWKRIGIGVVLAAAFIGYRFYQKHQDHDSVRNELVASCGVDSMCLQAVGDHFEHCFDKSYSIGSRRKQASLNYDKLLTCLNGRTGKPLFTLEPVAE